MLLRETSDGTVAVSQPAHALIAGQLARRWGGDAFAVPRPDEQVIAACSLHDLGWTEWEQAPVFNSKTGLPLEYQDVPAEIHTLMWSEGVRQAETYGHWIALLVSRHGNAIYEKTFDVATARPEAAAAVAEFLRSQRDVQARLIEAIDDTDAGIFCDAANLDVIKAFIVAVDTLSLHICRGIAGQTTIDEVPDRSGGKVSLTLTPTTSGIEIAPWPFADAAPFVVFVEGRLIRSPVDCQDALNRRLSTAKAVVVDVSLHAQDRTGAIAEAAASTS